MFFSMFWGRTDVYSKRTIKKSTGEVNYLRSVIISGKMAVQELPEAR